MMSVWIYSIAVQIHFVAYVEILRRLVCMLLKGARGMKENKKQIHLYFISSISATRSKYAFTIRDRACCSKRRCMIHTLSPVDHSDYVVKQYVKFNRLQVIHLRQSTT